MATERSSYLGTLGRELRLDARRKREIVRELHTHVEDLTEDLQAQGLSPQEALNQAVQKLGNPAEIARGMYSVHSTGSWKEVLLATLPHLLLASIFALHLWSNVFWVVVALVTASAVAILAWRAGRPKWGYSWLGYALAAPMIAWMLALASLGYGTWMFVTHGTLPLGLPLYIGIALYIPFSLWAAFRIASRVVRQDWLMVSLMALPLPFLASWFFFLHWRNGLLTTNTQDIQKADADTALVFLALAMTTALFLKVGRRALRIALVVVTTPVLLAIATLAYQRDPNSLPVILATFGTAAFLVSPVFLESRAVREARWRECAPDEPCDMLPSSPPLYPTPR